MNPVPVRSFALAGPGRAGSSVALALVATGWRAAEVTVACGRPPEVRARYRDGSRIVLRCALSTHCADPGDRRAWIGGWGRQMVVLFPHGPHAVPAYAIGPRISRSPR